MTPLVPLQTILKADHGSKIEIESSPYKVGTSDTIGRRETMEDEIVVKGTLYAVFDGHGGKNAALLCSHVLDIVFEESTKESKEMKEVFALCFNKLHQQIVSSRIKSGTTALISYIDQDDSSLWVAHVGDSRAVLFADGKAVRLTEDHKPNSQSEKKRVISEGGKITHRLFSKVYRVNDTLSITRALGKKNFITFFYFLFFIFFYFYIIFYFILFFTFIFNFFFLLFFLLGDQDFQKYGITHSPEVSGPHSIKNAEFIILACDGLWDVISDKKACALIRKENDPNVQATMLREFAFKKGSSDNIR